MLGEKEKTSTYKILLIIGLIIISSLSVGCIENNPIEGEAYTITDSTGREIDVPEDIESIVAVGSGSMRLITYINGTEYLAGVEEYEKEERRGRPYALANPEIAEHDSIGPIHGGDMELIAEKNPDVIFRSIAAEKEAELYEEKTGIPTVNLDVGDLSQNRDTFYETLSLLGEILDKEERAENVIDYIESEIDELKSRTEDISSKEKQDVFIGGVLHRGSHDLRSTYGEYAPFNFTNSNNVAEDIGMDHAMVDNEKILEWDPEIIFVDMGSYARGAITLDKPEYEELTAFENGEIYGLLPYNWHHINYGTVLANAYFVGEILYPDRFEDTRPSEKANEIYENLVGEAVYEEMEEDLGGFIELKLRNRITFTHHRYLFCLFSKHAPDNARRIRYF